MAVDNKGNPAIVGKESPRHIWYKREGEWVEYEGCARGVEFDEEGTMYRLGCDSLLYLSNKPLSTTKIWQFSVNNNGLWIIDDNKAVKKWDGNNRFV